MDSKLKGDMAEAFVNRIAYSALLKYWCYPNPRDITKDNKEICDLLVVFDSICIIISVKNYSFKGDYGKYFRKTVDNALSQILGAERKLFGDRPILIKHPDRSEELFPKQKIETILRIIVNLNTAPKFYRPFFQINETDWVSIFDSDAWEALLTEMNTIQDIVEYLKARAKIFRGRPVIMLPREEFNFDEHDAFQFTTHLEKDQFDSNAWVILSGSEKDLLAYYIFNAFGFPENLYTDERPFFFFRVDGMWNRFVKSKLNADKQKFERKSYFLDHLVQDLLIKQPKGDKISKVLYSLDRWQRSRLIDEFFKFHDSIAALTPRPTLHRSNVSFDDLHFIFIFFDGAAPLMSDELLEGFIDKSLHYRNYLMDYKCEEVIAIGFSHDFDSCAFGYISKDDALSDEEKTETERMYKDLGWRMRNDE